MDSAAPSTTSMMSTSTPTPLRDRVGPLTTTFFPDKECSIAQVVAHETDVSNGTSVVAFLFSAFPEIDVCTAGKAGLVSTCLPGITNYEDVAGNSFFYSPGLVCPFSWTTVTTLASSPELFTGGSPWVNGIRVDTLEPDETVAICCPR
jgi:hypothetical protein